MNATISLQMSTLIDDEAEVALLLAEEKLAVEKERRSNGEILLFLLRAEKFDSALKLLENRPDCNVNDVDGNSSLHVVLDSSHGQ